MRKAAYSDKALVVDILSRAFNANPSVNYIIRQDQQREERIRKLMAYSFEQCWSFGGVYLSDDRQGCALTLLPDTKKTTLSTILLDIQLAFSVIGIGRLKKILDREAKVHQGHPKEPFFYLWFLGVAPEFQNRGTGSALLQELIDESQRMKRPVYLETSLVSNISFYQKFGFEVYRELAFDQTLYCMKRPV